MMDLLPENKPFVAHCCDRCAAHYKVRNELQDLTNTSKFCELCCNLGPGGKLMCTIDHWHTVKPLSVLRPGSSSE
jgi:hypothetical protein